MGFIYKLGSYKLGGSRRVKVQKVHARGPDKCLMTSTGSIGGEEARTHRNSEKSSGLPVKGERKRELIEISVKPHCHSLLGIVTFALLPLFKTSVSFSQWKTLSEST